MYIKYFIENRACIFNCPFFLIGLHQTGQAAIKNALNDR